MPKFLQIYTVERFYRQNPRVLTATIFINNGYSSTLLLIFFNPTGLGSAILYSVSLDLYVITRHFLISFSHAQYTVSSSSNRVLRILAFLGRFFFLVPSLPLYNENSPNEVSKMYINNDGIIIILLISH